MASTGSYPQCRSSSAWQSEFDEFSARISRCDESSGNDYLIGVRFSVWSSPRGTACAFAERDIPTYWTATHGTMLFESNGETWTVATQADATTDPTALRGDAEVEAEPPEPPTEQEPLAALMVGMSPRPDVRRSVAPLAVTTGVNT